MKFKEPVMVDSKCSKIVGTRMMTQWSDGKITWSRINALPQDKIDACVLFHSICTKANAQEREPDVECCHNDIIESFEQELEIEAEAYEARQEAAEEEEEEDED